ncbi:MAG: Na+/H+ antiporter NhaA [Sedimenticola sp.]|jgi:NhaA family Na+:H+ antiporter|nr:MAG: Na+/H+ antiporter NhaA [Sedimenticola sp.]
MPIIISPKEFIKLESAGGIILIIAAVLAMVIANSPLALYYDMLIDVPVEIRVGPFELAKPLILWINDGLMAVFFFVVGLELKREMLDGNLSDWRSITLPLVGAIGGMVVPALIYLAFNWDDPMTAKGWAIPAATDIAFALAVLSLFGTRIPIALKVFLTSLAIFDDVGAILIIAIFYTEGLSVSALVITLACLALLFVYNRRGETKFSPYIVVGLIMWVAVLKSGVHATLAGVLLAMFIPLQDPLDARRSPLREMEHDLHSMVAFVILPLFAFVNSGISLQGVGMEYLLHPVPLGISFGLFFGKQIGVFLFCWLGVQLRLLKLPADINWMTLYGVSLLCGIGFTMSLFIGSLAFESSGENMLFDERLGIIIGSVVSAVAGYFVIRKAVKVAA